MDSHYPLFFFFKSPFPGAGEMAQQVKALAAKLGSLN